MQGGSARCGDVFCDARSACGTCPLPISSLGSRSPMAPRSAAACATCSRSCADLLASATAAASAAVARSTSSSARCLSSCTSGASLASAGRSSTSVSASGCGGELVRGAQARHRGIGPSKRSPWAARSIDRSRVLVWKMSRRPSLLFRRHRAQIAPKWAKTRRRPPVKHTHVALRVSEVRVRVRGGRGVRVCGLGVRLRDPLVAGVQPITGKKKFQL